MEKMIKGANVGLAALSENAGSVVMSLGWSSPTGEGDADVSVLLLDGDGKVRSDADFCFYNNPVVGNGSVQLLGKTPTADGNEDRISFDLDAIPVGVERLVVAASRYGGARFGDLNDLHLTLADGSGDGLVQFSVGDAGAVSACIFGELYRRDGAWKFRAVGQGYESGLAGLATDFGVDIDDDAEEEGEAAAPEGEAEDGSGRQAGPLPAVPSPRTPESVPGGASPAPTVPADAGETPAGQPKPQA
ncbi:TerD family protein, partial [Streptomyces sp. NRRL WC-3549]|uniref:TerD family protein n=1 Tax=Streptomyces sp. NRRL WC-3549 TaxID=1463925 RepID=UPI0004C85EB3